MTELTRTSLGTLTFANTAPTVGTRTELTSEVDLGATTTDFTVEFDIDFTGASGAYLEVYSSFANSPGLAGVEGYEKMQAIGAQHAWDPAGQRRARYSVEIRGRYWQCVVRNQTNATLATLSILDAVTVKPT